MRVPCLHNPPHDDLAAQLKKPGFVWIDLEDPTDEDLAKLAKLITLHPLTLEDARTFQQRPKIEEYEGYMFMVVFGVDDDTESGGPLLREIHLIISGDYVVRSIAGRSRHWRTCAAAMTTSRSAPSSSSSTRSSTR